MEPIVILNPGANRFNEAEAYFKSQSIDYILCEEREDMEGIVHDTVDEGHLDFLVCGGDGTINNFLHAYMALPEETRSTIRLGVLPGGTANDLAAELGIPGDIAAAYEHIMNSATKSVDVIRVNDRYFITGGALGFTSELTVDIDDFKATRLGKFLQERLGDTIFRLQVLKKLVFGYDGLREVEVGEFYHGVDIGILSVQNQPIMGGDFHIAPGADNADGKMNICVIPRSRGLLGHLAVFGKVTRGELLEDAVYLETDRVLVRTDGKHDFVGDGELLCYGDSFDLELIPGAIRLYR